MTKRIPIRQDATAAGLIKKEVGVDDFVMTRFMPAVEDGKSIRPAQLK
jgi:hypothetical protein